MQLRDIDRDRVMGVYIGQGRGDAEGTTMAVKLFRLTTAKMDGSTGWYRQNINALYRVIIVK